MIENESKQAICIAEMQAICIAVSRLYVLLKRIKTLFLSHYIVLTMLMISPFIKMQE